MKRIITFLLLLLSSGVKAQNSYTDSIRLYREKYKREFLEDSRSPLKAADTGYLRFFAADENYRVAATFTRTPKAKTFEMPTHSGKLKKYRQYGLLTFKIHDTSQTLEVYQGVDLMKQKGLEDYLFIPFTDMTNYLTTYAGGRYIDLRTGDIKNGKLLLDFNKCYNPYCAYADGYSCPIPPDANKLKVAIPAGEMLFGKMDD